MQQPQPQSSFEVSSFGGSSGSSVQDQSSFGGGSTNSFDDPLSRELQQQRQSQSSIGDSTFEVSSFGGSYGGTPSVRDQSSFGSINSVRDTPLSKKHSRSRDPIHLERMSRRIRARLLRTCSGMMKRTGVLRSERFVVRTAFLSAPATASIHEKCHWGTYR